MPQPASTAHSSMGYMIEVKISGAFAEIYEAYAIPFPSNPRDEIDVTTLGSPDQEEEFILGVKRHGEMSFEVNFLPADPTHQYLETAKDNGSKEVFKITASDAGSRAWEFSGYVKQFNPMAAVNQAAKTTLIIKATGAITKTGT